MQTAVILRYSLWRNTGPKMAAAKEAMRVAVSAGTLRKRYALRALAILLVLVAAASFVLGSHNFIIRSFGLLALLAGAQLARMSRAQSPAFGRPDLTGSSWPGRVVWLLGLGVLVLAGLSFWLLYVDALHGGHAIWPIYVFAGVALACVGIWGYIASKLAG